MLFGCKDIFAEDFLTNNTQKIGSASPKDNAPVPSYHEMASFQDKQRLWIKTSIRAYRILAQWQFGKRITPHQVDEHKLPYKPENISSLS